MSHTATPPPYKVFTVHHTTLGSDLNIIVDSADSQGVTSNKALQFALLITKLK